ncbi:precorrin-6y C5,15-methyltransferase (decarboxylating) subunit CbiE [Picrophilus oshimae]|uniref:Precorrin-6Y C5,15-methyltransferase (Decarboxylating) n=1 Tax=Picrophilus torridus (strain ATCC 700027 / DSM 9790 / JCM 10055 / NBRC 100828 / KAW 2/3) TaxID=1122961 RepID=A0A8G2L7E7_PICTO|nr:precorrin-6y C5,15-methyltransferase (decarboxylating) subunit CbiE [Picrophilus oshimae]SMD30910.1 precorrin-6Y C5,15-methyltransferase (decarboxylating) [Picrophilus oshimae DSM 9789]
MINVIGINPCRKLSRRAFEIIESSDLIISGERNSHIINKKIDFYIKDLKSTVEFIDKNINKNICIIASGDPLFFGIGASLSSRYKMNILTETSSIAIAMSRINEDYHDAVFISLHGRSINGLAQRIEKNRKIIILTDDENNPSRIAKYLMEFNLNYEMYVFENLCYDNEKIYKLNPEEASKMSFSRLNIVYLKSNKDNYIYPDDDDLYKINSNITKSEIRDITLRLLNIKDNDVFWDIGAGSGFISISASKAAPGSLIYSIEKNKNALRNIYLNSRRFHSDINIIDGEAPYCLDDLPDPDAVFIGGSSGLIDDIIEYSYKRLRPGGRLVLNIATLNSLARAVNKMEKLFSNFSFEEVSVFKSSRILSTFRFEPVNPVFILHGEKDA